MHSCTYDIKSTSYRDHVMRKNAWEEIAQEMNLTVALVKSTWEKLRNSYNSAMRRRKVKSGQAASKIVPWKFEQEMSFLKPFSEMRETHTNLINDTPTLEDDENIEYSSNENLHNNAENVIEKRESSISNKSAASPLSDATNEVVHSERAVIPRSKKKLTPAEEMVQIMKNNAELRAKCARPTSENGNNLDETDMFYLSMSKTVKRLPQIEQAKIRMKLCQLIYEAEIKEIEHQLIDIETYPQVYSTSQSLIQTPLPSPLCSTTIGSTPSINNILASQREYTLTEVFSK
ncbi:hypothetical protein ABEB36_004654 [Hypothenemus hampei]|uniref:Transcription factor Adf-1 n=1 Tax=Hypothenemus hampei TaxID=57062 RepID=A0ABD1F439_HYPHA